MNKVKDTLVVLDDVAQERVRQDLKWGEQNHSQMEWLGILAEEFGEAAKDINEFHFRRNIILNQRKLIRAELIQVAAVAVHMVEALDREAREIEEETQRVQGPK